MLLSRLRAPLAFTATLLTLWPALVASQNSPLDQAGYPRDGIHHDSTIIPSAGITKTATFMWIAEDTEGAPRELSRFFNAGPLENYANATWRTRYENLIKSQGIVLPNDPLLTDHPVRVTTKGVWKSAGVHNLQSTAKDTITLTASNTTTISRSLATQINVGLSMDTTIKGAPLGVGADFTIGQSIGFGLTTAWDTSNASGWSAAFTLRPATRLQMWQRVTQIDVTFNTSIVFKNEDAFLIAMAESFGESIWTTDFYGTGPNGNSYLSVVERAKAQATQGGGGEWTVVLKRELMNLKDPGSDYKSRWDMLKDQFNYQRFSQIGQINLSYTLPNPEFYATRSPSPNR